MFQRTSRRGFFKNLSVTGGALSISALSYSRVFGANERLRVACVGTGGKGWSDLTSVANSTAVQVTALCDIDSSLNHLGRAAEKFADAKTYQDWRRMLGQADRFDAVIVATPDFMHAPISLSAMQLGKHVYCEKPLTHTVSEAREMHLAAVKNRVVTQMGNQIQSHTAYRTAVQIVQNGLIGKVIEVHSWQGGSPSWPRNIHRPDGADPVPEQVRWDLWQGVSPRRPYKDGLYHPFNWRGWQAFGTGQLGDFGCHILDPVFKSLELTAPTQLVADAPPLKEETWTDSATVHYQFPGTKWTSSDSIKVVWYDAVGARPPKESLQSLPDSLQLPNAGSVLVGEKGTLLIPHVAMPRLFLKESPDGQEAPSESLPLVQSVDHYVQWADACRGADQTTSSFDYSGPLTEAVLLGTVAIRMPGQSLTWDCGDMRITNMPEANQWLTKTYQKGWRL